jgi:hypothetical protein
MRELLSDGAGGIGRRRQSLNPRAFTLPPRENTLLRFSAYFKRFRQIRRKKHGVHRPAEPGAFCIQPPLERWLPKYKQPAGEKFRQAASTFGLICF